MTEHGPEIIHTHLVGGPAHREPISVSTAFATLQVLVHGQRVEYQQRRFLLRDEAYALWVWPALTDTQAEALAWEEICGS